MTTWVVCRHCQLKHTQRPDGLCPRCKAAVGGVETAEAEPQPPPQGAETPRPQLREERPVLSSLGALGPPAAELPMAARIAGAVLIVNAIAAGAERAIVSQASSAPSQPVAYVIDAVLGVMLLAGKEKALPWAKLRAGLALVVLPALMLAQGDARTAVIQVLYCGGLLALLIGNAGTPRLAAAGVALAVCLSFGVAGLYSGALAQARPLLRSDVEPEVAAQVEGREFRYRLTAPNDRWRVRKAEAMRKDNPLADRWLVRPDADAHLLVIAEVVPGSGPIDVEEFVNVVSENSRKNWTRFKLLEQKPLQTKLAAARLLRTEGLIKGLDVDCYHGLFVQGRSIFHVWGFAKKPSFSAVKDDLVKLISSFELIGL